MTNKITTADARVPVRCSQCDGEGWLHPPIGDGEICPNCDGTPDVIGGTGIVREPLEPPRKLTGKRVRSSNEL